ncbi:NAD(P)-dependent oxidoreductase [soil metagenome]
MNQLEKLELELVNPSESLIADIAKIDGDIMILGVGGKMGPSLARLAKRAIDKSGINKKIIGVSRFSQESSKQELEKEGIETISADLLNEDHLKELPDVKNIIFMAGTKFGTAGNEYFTWAMNAYLPGRVAEKFKNSNIVVFSTGNVYPFVPVSSGGATEETPVDPVGEYAQSCLGRERIFEFFSRKFSIPMLIYRLNYAIDFRYGILLEVAKSVREGKEIDLRTGNVNVIWQGDANEFAIRSLLHCQSPPTVLNITGPETVSIRWLAKEFGLRFKTDPRFINQEESTALLNNASLSHQIFGYPKVSLRKMIDLTVEWLEMGGEISQKPTHFQERKGKF